MRGKFKIGDNVLLLYREENKVCFKTNKDNYKAMCVLLQQYDWDSSLIKNQYSKITKKRSFYINKIIVESPS